MRFIILTLALMACISVNAQREYRVCNDDLYLSETQNCRVDGYDEVEEVYDVETKKLVIHKNVKNVYHVYEPAVERHYTISQPLTSRRRCVSQTRPRYRNRCNVVTVPRRVYSSYTPIQDCYDEQYTCLSEYNENKWFFYFQLNSNYLTNREELGHLIDYAKSNPCSVFYIDAYADAETGGYDVNMRISKMRANAIISVLLNEGIERNRLFVQHHGSVSQPYKTNNLNRCVTVTVGNR